MAKKATTKKATAKKTSTKRDINKSQLIRDYKKAHPKKGPTEIGRELSAQHNTNIPASMVSNVLGKTKKAKKKAKPAAAAMKPSMPSDDLKAASSHLLQAVELVASAGAKEARMLVDMAEKVIARVRK
ncbi:MAG: hypothetical protein KDA42_06495 [Planctomycetales bacterium]|nr:hypothetical protein [Planctomycetales bacterium]